MARLHSRLLVPALLRPIGEHLVSDLAPRRDERCVDAGCENGVMAALLGRASDTCVAVHADAEVVAETREELSMLHLDHVDVLRARLDELPLGDDCAQVVASLFALTFEPDPARTLGELLRVLDPDRGRLACALWCDFAGRRIDTAPLLGVAGGGARIETMRDVARFDGVAHYRVAVGEHAPPLEAAWTAADGTLRIPTETAVLRYP